VTAVEDSLVDILTNSNIIYLTQVNVFLAVGISRIRTAANSDSFNQKRPCSLNINSNLDAFTNWRRGINEDGQGVYQLLTDCYPY